jgi:uncharacterized spore protein YtfJ
MQSRHTPLRAIVDNTARTIGRGIRTRRSTQLLFGPIYRAGETSVIPVAEARLRLGLAGAAGSAAGGGGLRVEPVGFITVRDSRADFTPIRDSTRLILVALAAAGILLGILLRLTAGRGGESRARRGG